MKWGPLPSAALASSEGPSPLPASGRQFNHLLNEEMESMISKFLSWYFQNCIQGEVNIEEQNK